MIDVIQYIFQGLVNREIDSNIDIKALKKILPKAGFDYDEIYCALDWVEHTVENTDYREPALTASKAIRVYSEYEKAKFSEDARGVLLYMEQNNFITPALRELIIDRALVLPLNYIGKEEIRWVLLFAMLNVDIKHQLIKLIETKLINFPFSDRSYGQTFEA